MKLTTWNVNGVRAREAQVLDWVQRERPDVLCLQEIKASPAAVPAPLCALDGYWCYWHGFKGYSGVGLLLLRERFPKRPRFFHPAFDEEHRIVAAEVEDRIFASIYVPNGNKDYEAKLRFVEGMDLWIAEQHAAGKRLLLGGDLNVAREERDVHPKLSRIEQIGQTPQERTVFARWLARGLVDLGRQFEPDNDRLFTWWAPWRNMRERNMGWRLDYVLVSESLGGTAVGMSHVREFGTSDHGPVSVSFDDAAFTFEGPADPADPAVSQATPAPEPPKGPSQIPLL